MPSLIFSALVTNRSSPTSWHSLPSSSFSFFQPSQSFSPMPSSIETTWYFSTSVRYRAISPAWSNSFFSFLKMYLPVALSNSSLEATSRAMATSLPGV